MKYLSCSSLIALALMGPVTKSAAQSPPPDEAAFRALYKELIRRSWFHPDIPRTAR